MIKTIWEKLLAAPKIIWLAIAGGIAALLWWRRRPTPVVMGVSRSDAEELKEKIEEESITEKKSIEQRAEESRAKLKGKFQ